MSVCEFQKSEKTATKEKELVDITLQRECMYECMLDVLEVADITTLRSVE